MKSCLTFAALAVALFGAMPALAQPGTGAMPENPSIRNAILRAVAVSEGRTPPPPVAEAVTPVDTPPQVDSTPPLVLAMADTADRLPDLDDLPADSMPVPSGNGLLAGAGNSVDAAPAGLPLLPVDARRHMAADTPLSMMSLVSHTDEEGAGRPWREASLGRTEWQGAWLLSRFPGAPFARTGVEPGLKAVVHVSRQEMDLFEDGQLLATWKVSTGKKGHETDIGEFRSHYLNRDHYSSQYDNAPMPCSVFFNGGEAFHGTKAVNMLGQPASHGCVRLEIENACRLYDMVEAAGENMLKVSVLP